MDPPPDHRWLPSPSLNGRGPPSRNLAPRLAIAALYLFYGVVRDGRGRAARALGTLVLAASLGATWTLAPLRLAAADEAVADHPNRSGDHPALALPAELFGCPILTPPEPIDIDAATSYAAGRGVVGLAVLDRETGNYTDNGAGAHTAMGSASVIKLLMAEEILHRAALGQVQLGPSEYSRIETMLVDSNDAATSSLYSQFGSVSLILAALTRHGLTESAAPADPQYWGNTTITAHDVAELYDNLLAGSLALPSRDYLFGLLRRIAPIAVDGFGQIFGLATGDAVPNAAVKQGWMCCLDGVRNVHSTGVLGDEERYVVVVLTQYSPALPWEYGLTTTSEVARLVIGQLDNRPPTALTVNCADGRGAGLMSRVYAVQPGTSR
ncbi:hypothetical protein BH24ACT9_BH24ACT9_05730 [soil metagenome]